MGVPKALLALSESIIPSSLPLPLNCPCLIHSFSFHCCLFSFPTLFSLLQRPSLSLHESACVFKTLPPFPQALFKPLTPYLFNIHCHCPYHIFSLDVIFVHFRHFIFFLPLSQSCHRLSRTKGPRGLVHTATARPPPFLFIMLHTVLTVPSVTD